VLRYAGMHVDVPALFFKDMYRHKNKSARRMQTHQAEAVERLLMIKCFPSKRSFCVLRGFGHFLTCITTEFSAAVALMDTSHKVINLFELPATV
jgi:hypothetical protein